MRNEKNTFKLSIVGEAGVGKSSIVERIVRNRFLTETSSTIGAAFSQHKYGDRIYQMWDTAGQERYKSLIPMYLRDSKVVLIVYDITNMYSLQRIKDYWYKFAVDNVDEDCILVLVGNKWDIHRFNTHSIESDASDFAKEHDLLYYQVSAKNGTNIASMFKSIDKEVDVREKAKIKFDDDGIEITDGNKSGLVLIDWEKLKRSRNEPGMISSCTGERCNIQ